MHEWELAKRILQPPEKRAAAMKQQEIVVQGKVQSELCPQHTHSNSSQIQGIFYRPFLNTLSVQFAYAETKCNIVAFHVFGMSSPAVMPSSLRPRTAADMFPKGDHLHSALSIMPYRSRAQLTKIRRIFADADQSP